MSGLSMGMIGFSEGNGHPFSFSAIVNGYDSEAIRAAGWSVIADYLDRQSRHDIGFHDARVTCCWADDQAIARDIARSCGIDDVVPPAQMLERGLDAVIVARDDWQSHLALAMPFLEAGIPVFVDKPLTLDREQLARFEPHLRSGRLMSCSALRYARELDLFRADPAGIGRLQLVNAVVPLSMDRYGIHLLEAALGVMPLQLRPVFARRIEDRGHALFETPDGALFTIHALGRTAKRFRLSFYGDKGGVEVDLADNFSAFRRCLREFVQQVQTGRPAIDPSQTLSIMELMIEAEAMAGA